MVCGTVSYKFLRQAIEDRRHVLEVTYSNCHDYLAGRNDVAILEP
jgi:hypothetical protein